MGSRHGVKTWDQIVGFVLQRPTLITRAAQPAPMARGRSPQAANTPCQEYSERLRYWHSTVVRLHRQTCRMQQRFGVAARLRETFEHQVAGGLKRN